MFLRINEDSFNPLLTFKESRKPKNRALNRYKNVSPYDHSRILLTDSPVDYVNANLVDVSSVGRRYILSQGPLEMTTSHFWLMIWQQESKGIVMLNALFEKKVPKCHQYWPDKVGETLKFSDVQLAVCFILCTYLLTSLKIYSFFFRSSWKTKLSIQYARPGAYR